MAIDLGAIQFVEIDIGAIQSDAAVTYPIANCDGVFGGLGVTPNLVIARCDGLWEGWAFGGGAGSPAYVARRDGLFSGTASYGTVARCDGVSSWRAIANRGTDDDCIVANGNSGNTDVTNYVY